MRQPLPSSLQLLRRIGRLLGQRGVPPGHFVELRDDLVDVGNALLLLLAETRCTVCTACCMVSVPWWIWPLLRAISSPISRGGAVIAC